MWLARRARFVSDWARERDGVRGLYRYNRRGRKGRESAMAGGATGRAISCGFVLTVVAVCGDQVERHQAIGNRMSEAGKIQANEDGNEAAHEEETCNDASSSVPPSRLPSHHHGVNPPCGLPVRKRANSWFNEVIPMAREARRNVVSRDADGYTRVVLENSSTRRECLARSADFVELVARRALRRSLQMRSGGACAVARPTMATRSSSTSRITSPSRRRWSALHGVRPMAITPARIQPHVER